MYGYSPETSRSERQWEEKLRAIPSPENLRAYMEHLSAKPHHVVCAARDKENAEWIAAKFKEFGLDTHIESYDVLFPTPRERQVELLDCRGANGSDCQTKFTAKLEGQVCRRIPLPTRSAEATAKLLTRIRGMEM